jgi:hypothetical protein
MLKGTSPKAAPESTTTAPDSRAAFLHFITTDGREFGFPFAQLLHFVLEPNPPPVTGSAAPPQHLLLAFPSHDVTLTGYRLHLLCEGLDQRRALRLKAEDTRFANLHPNQPFVAGIAITMAAQALITAAPTEPQWIKSQKRPSLPEAK